MPNPNNCQCCDHMHNRVRPRDDALHCYMFKDAPTAVCMCHTGRKGVTANEVIGELFALRRRGIATQDKSQSLHKQEGSNAGVTGLPKRSVGKSELT